jgi:hypothetical protein
MKRRKQAAKRVRLSSNVALCRSIENRPQRRGDRKMQNILYSNPKISRFAKHIAHFNMITDYVNYIVEFVATNSIFNRNSQPFKNTVPPFFQFD